MIDATSKVSVVVGGQYGSEAKGHVAAYLAKNTRGPVSAVRVAGPNAGHTVLGRGPKVAGQPQRETPDHPWRLRQIPVPAVSRPDARLYIAAGSEIDLEVLTDEMSSLDAAGYGVTSRLFIDSSATILTPEHIRIEQAMGLQARLGSTAKGIGEARVDRIRRLAHTWGGALDVAGRAGARDVIGSDVSRDLEDDLRYGAHVIIEGTQGYGLGLHTKNYPYTTSSDCRAIDFLAMAGVSPWSPEVHALDVWVVLRTRPIRVAGNSGPLGAETSWDELDLPAEYTTVTQKVRRVGEWDGQLARDAVAANGRDVKVALTMVDQVFPWITGRTSLENWSDEETDVIFTYLDRIEAEIGASVELIGTGPATMIPVSPSVLNSGGGRPGIA